MYTVKLRTFTVVLACKSLNYRIKVERIKYYNNYIYNNLLMNIQYKKLPILYQNIK